MPLLVSVIELSVTAGTFGESLGTGAEGSISAPKHGNPQVGICLEMLKCRMKCLGGWAIYGILFMRTINNNGARCDLVLRYERQGCSR
tara:strand:- start:165 stop:428 length:264 start_codon:yes stop_codon:yes gene_type:complete